MPIMDMLTGEILIALVTILWGIFVETWFVSRWTIFFNVIPLFVIMMTQDLGLFVWVIVGYTVVAIILSQTNDQDLRQLVGAKSYGTLTLSLTLYSFTGIGTGWAIGAFIGFSILVYVCWLIVYAYKKSLDQEKEYYRRVQEAQRNQQELQLRQKRQQFFQYYGYWPNW